MRATLVLIIALSGAIIGIVSIPHIDRWERANNYPYGKLCDLYRQCRSWNAAKHGARCAVSRCI